MYCFLAGDCAGVAKPDTGNFTDGDCTNNETTGSGCTLGCANGYIVTGDLSVTCQASGNYSTPGTNGSCAGIH